MAAILGLFSAFCIGASDVFGRKLSNRTSVITTTASLQLFAALIAASLALLDNGSTFVTVSFAWGAIAGLGMGTGLATYYQGLSQAGAALVSPLVAALHAIIPLIWLAMTGQPVRLITLLGAALAVIGLLLITIGSVTNSWDKKGLLWGLVSGIAYGIGVTAYAVAANSSSWWPVAGQRASSWLLMSVLAILTANKPILPPRTWHMALTGGVLFALTSLTLLAGLAIDRAPAMITVSTFPAFAVLFGRIFFAERVKLRQVVGIVTVTLGVAIVSIN